MVLDMTRTSILYFNFQFPLSHIPQSILLCIRKSWPSMITIQMQICTPGCSSAQLYFLENKILCTCKHLRHEYFCESIFLVKDKTSQICES